VRVALNHRHSCYFVRMIGLRIMKVRASCFIVDHEGGGRPRIFLNIIFCAGRMDIRTFMTYQGGTGISHGPGASLELQASSFPAIKHDEII
jgi:hypothetical protein